MDHIPIHYGVIVSNTINKKSFTHRVLSKQLIGPLSVYNNYQGILFSDLAIVEFIQKEYKYHTTEITSSQHRQLYTFSSGERRKIFLEYCLAQNPDYIILDNVFDHLDQESRLELSQQLMALSPNMSMLQLAHDEESLLPFITNTYYVNDNEFVVSDVKISAQSHKSKSLIFFSQCLGVF